MSFKEKLEQWDSETLAPIMGSIGDVIKNAGLKGVINPVIDIAGGTIVSIIENGASIYCAYQEAASKIQRNKEQNKAIKNINSKIINGMEQLYDQMINAVSDSSEPLTEEKLRDIYIRVQMLSKIAVNSGYVLDHMKRLDANIKQLIQELPEGSQIINQVNYTKLPCEA